MTLGAIFMLRLRANFRVDKPARFCYTAFCCAGVAHLVERHLAKVEVAGSSPVARSTSEQSLLRSVSRRALSGSALKLRSASLLPLLQLEPAALGFELVGVRGGRFGRLLRL